MNYGNIVSGGGLGGLAALPLGHGQLTILVVEDDRCLRRLLARVLSFEGYTVCTARNGIEALEVLHHHSVSLIVTDLCMPGMDGGELIRQLERYRPWIPVIVLSGESDAWKRFHLKGRCNLRSFLLKPITVEVLLSEVAATLQERNFDLSKINPAR